MSDFKSNNYWQSAERLKIESERAVHVHRNGTLNSALKFFELFGVEIPPPKLTPAQASSPEAVRAALEPHMTALFAVAEIFTQKIHGEPWLGAADTQTIEDAQANALPAAKAAPSPEPPPVVEEPKASEKAEAPQATKSRENPGEPGAVERRPSGIPTTEAIKNNLRKHYEMLGTPEAEQHIPASQPEAVALLKELSAARNRLQAEQRQRDSLDPRRGPSGR